VFSAVAPRGGIGSIRLKSLLLLFFRKEESSFLKERSKELFYCNARRRLRGSLR
jgi:hypothetical protein